MKRFKILAVLAVIFGAASAFSPKLFHAPGFFGLTSPGTEVQLTGFPSNPNTACDQTAGITCVTEYDSHGNVVATEGTGYYKD